MAGGLPLGSLSESLEIFLQSVNNDCGHSGFNNLW